MFNSPESGLTLVFDRHMEENYIQNTEHDYTRWRTIALKHSKNRRIVKNARNRIETPSACAYYPFILLSFKHPSESSKYIVAWFRLNHKTANPAREPHITWQRLRFLSFSVPSCPARLLFSFFPASLQHEHPSVEERGLDQKSC